MTQKNLFISAVSAAVLLLTSGCATKAIDKMEGKVEGAQRAADLYLGMTKKDPSKLVTYTDQSYIPMRKMARSEYTLSQQKLLGIEIAINRNFNNLSEIAAWLTSITGSQAILNPELLNASSMSTTPSAPGGVMPGGASLASSLPGAPTASALSSKPLSVSYSGSVTGFLDFVAANYGVFWKLEDSNIRFLLTESRTFRISALPGETQLTTTVGASSNSGSSGVTTGSGISNNTAGMTFSGLSVWTGIETGVKQLLTPVTGKVGLSTSTGTITVTDTPLVLDQVAEYIKEQNLALSRQVSVNVRVLSIELNDRDAYGINWDAVYTNLSNNVIFKAAGPFTPVTGSANFVLQTAGAGGSWGAASGAVISALSTQGRVSELTSATLVTINNQPAPVNIGRQVSYVASSATTTTTGAGNTTTLTPGQVSTGFNMVIVPHIINGKELLLQSSINLSSLLELKTVTSGTSSIQTPDLSTSNFIQRVRLSSGDMLVAAGFDQDNLSAVSNGVGDAKNALFGSQAANGKKTMLVILIQPLVAN